ncbi:MAG: SNF2-related protein, partial [Acidobacteriota bacterium]
MHDPDDPHDASRVDPDEAAERLQLRFLAEAPKLPGAEDLGAATAAVTPWPHQLRVVRRAVASYPQSYLFADEVGLGKTLEAGLALRQLWISGRVRRVLILVPRAVLRQWQEELREKLGLDVPRLEGRQVLDVFDREVDGDAKVESGVSVWDRYPLLLASSQTARSKRRRDALLAARRWDLVIVDEAHHARRRQARLDAFRPNRLLELLAGPAARDGEHIERRGLIQRSRCVYLLTATPMQVHPVEVWDLLRLLGLGGRWGARPEPFVAFFEELRKPSPSRDWRFLLTLLADAVELHASWGVDLRWPSVLQPIVEPAIEGDLDTAIERVRAVDAEIVDRLDRLLRDANPVRALVFRHTRERLRRYRREGRLSVDVPEREPENVWIELSPEERALYRRIEAYLSRFYQRYEAKRTGLGFVMTVYRRRLTSSFAAVRRSLERRRAWLVGQNDTTGLLGADDRIDDDPGGQADLFDALEATFEDTSTNESPGGLAVPTSRDELEHLDAFLDALASLDGDSKLDRLTRDLGDLLAERDRVLVFTQYTDTMDHLRDHLRTRIEAPVGSHTIACYSGRGGERWDGEAWVPWDKESLKAAFGDGQIRVLLCT